MIRGKKKRRRFSGFVMKRGQFQQAFGDGNVETITLERPQRSRTLKRLCLTVYNCLTNTRVRKAILIALAVFIILVASSRFLVAPTVEQDDVPMLVNSANTPTGVAAATKKSVLRAAEGKPLEVLVLGMHHSGTSLVTKMLSLLGIYMGEDKDLLMLKGNALKYFELKAAVLANKKVMSQGWMRKGPWWYGYGFNWDRLSEIDLEVFRKAVTRIVDKMRKQAEGRSWLIKDPRLCLLAEEYLKPLKNPVCVVVWRDVLQLSQRLLSYNTVSTRLSLSEIAEVWKHYTRESVRACNAAGAPIIYVAYEDFVTRPLQVADRLSKEFGELGLKPVSRDPELLSIFNDQFVEKHVKKKNLSQSNLNLLNRLKHLVGSDAWQIQAHVASQGRLEVAPSVLSDSSWTWSLQQEKAVIGKEAYFTMVTSDSPGYVAGAEVLGASIRSFDSKRDLVAMLTKEVKSPETKRRLRLAGWRVVRVDKLEEPWYNVHQKCKRFTQAQVVRWGRMYSKLNLWASKYKKVVYLDSDTLVLRNIEDYFKLPLPFYGERSPSHKGINAGILVVEPSKHTLEQMIEFAKTHEPLEFFKRNQVGCTEQELLNRFWHGETMTVKLNDTRHADFLSKRFTEPEGREVLLSKGSAVVHWLTTKCPKPWDIDVQNLSAPKHKSRSRSSPTQRIIPPYCDPQMYKLWHSIYWAIKPVSTFVETDLDSVPLGLRLES